MIKKMATARYKTSEEFPGYRFYDDGRVQIMKDQRYSWKAGRDTHNPYYLAFSKMRVHPQYGILMMNLVDKDGVQRTVYPHVMVATLFVKKKEGEEGKKRVWFKDNNKKNLLWSNLFWVDQGDLNRIQEGLGRRDMKRQATLMREKRPPPRGRPPGVWSKKMKFIESNFSSDFQRLYKTYKACMQKRRERESKRKN